MSSGLLPGLGPESSGLMFLTRTVPASVPSDFHSSRPRVPSLAEKNTMSPRAAISRGALDGACGAGHPTAAAPDGLATSVAARAPGAARAVPAPARVTAAAVAALAARAP